MSNRVELTFEAALKKGIEAFEAANREKSKFTIENPMLEAQLLLAHALGLSRTRLILSFGKIIGDVALQRFEKLVAEKLKGVPTAYLLGSAEFYGREFYVDKSVLIPRPETEELVEWIVLSNFAGGNVIDGKDTPRPIENVLDLCTGSGCIGITLACETNLKSICLADRSKDALLTAAKNIESVLNLKNQKPPSPQKTKRTEKIEILQTDLFNGIEFTDFDLIVSNPPYVTADEYEYLDAGVKNFEPPEALLVLEPGKFNRRLTGGAFEHLRGGGWLYLETSPTLVTSLTRLFAEAGFTNIEVKKDLSGKDRFIRGQKP